MAVWVCSRALNARHVQFPEVTRWKIRRFSTRNPKLTLGSQTVRKKRAENFPPSIRPHRLLEQFQNKLLHLVGQEIARGEVAIRPGPDGLIVSLREIGFFASGSATIEARSKPAFSRMAALLAHRKFNLRIEGHTDNIPVHNSQFASNWELSTSRATGMVRLLITEHDIPAAQLSAAGYGEYHPIAGNDSAEGRSMNRRVDVVVLGKLPAETSEPD